MTLLTDEEINALDCVVINQSDWEEFEVFNPSVISFARAIEQAVLAKVEAQEPLAKLSLSTRGMEVTADYGVMCYGEEFDVYRHPAPMQKEPVDGTVTRLPVKRNDLQRLVESIKKIVHEMDGVISVTEAIGALELAKLETLKEQE